MPERECGESRKKYQDGIWLNPKCPRNGKSAADPEKGRVQRLWLDSPCRLARVRDSLLPYENMGTKDYSDYTPDQWRTPTYDEIMGDVPQGASTHMVLTANGPNVFKELVTPATIVDAKLRDWQSYDSGVLADIWVRTSPSEPPTVTTTGSPTVTTKTDATTYTFSGGSKGKATLMPIDYNKYVDQGNLQGCDTAFSYVQVTLPSATVPKPANPTKVKYNVRGRYTGDSVLTPGQTGYFTVLSDNLYDCTTWEECYRASDVSRSYVAKGAYVEGGKSGGGGSVTVGNYTPEVVSRKVLQPASLTPEKTTERRYTYYIRVPSSATEQTKTFLAQGGTTAIQNFAFDMEEE